MYLECFVFEPSNVTFALEEFCWKLTLCKVYPISDSYILIFAGIDLHNSKINSSEFLIETLAFVEYDVLFILGLISARNGLLPLYVAQAIQNLQISIFGINIVYSS